MKKALLFFILAGLTAIGANAQTKKLWTERDGFQWYEIYGSGGTTSAESINGKTLIPLSRGYSFICYHSEEYGMGYFSVEKNGKEGACDIKGNEIIAPEKGYDKVFLLIDSPKIGYFSVKKNGKEGACDIKGNEIIAPNYESIIYYNGFKYKDAYGKWIPLGITLDDYDLASKFKPSKNWISNNKSNNNKSTSTPTSYYASASFKDFSLEYNVPNGGRKMLKANYDLEVKGRKGHKMIVYFDIYNENDFRIMRVYTKLSKANYETTLWSNNWIGIYNDALNAQQGTHTYYAQLSVVDKKTKETLANSTKIAFEMTGNQQYYNHTPQYNIPPVNNYPQPNNNNYNNNQGGNYSISCTRCGGDGRCRGYGNTTAYMSLHCMGTGKCSTCSGKGYTINHYTGNNMTCPTCNGNGKCKQCGGSGICQKCGGSGKE